MKSAKKAVAVFLTVLMAVLGVFPVFAYEYTPENCPGHAYVEGDTVAPTCTASGYTEYTCSLCGNIKKDQIANPRGHAMQQEVVEPTCVAAGYTRNYCTREGCGYEFNNNYKPATGEHDWQLVSEQAATCGTAGYKQEQCSVCLNYRYTYPAATGNHNWQPDPDRSTRPATCARAGEEYYKCTVCGQQKAVNIPPTGNHVDANGDGQCDNCGVSVSNNPTGPVSIWSVFERIGNLFSQIWDRIMGLFKR